MAKILMLDLEGVLIETSIPKPGRDHGVRPHAQAFVDECLELFDKAYLNTCVRQERALGIMKELFCTEQFQFYPSNLSSKYGKADGYEMFLNDVLVHVEDEAPTSKEAQRIMELGHSYIRVPTWYVGHEIGKGVSDDALLVAMDRIKEALFCR